MLTRRTLLSTAVAAPAIALFAQTASAAEPEIFMVDGVAIRGTDPVAFFTDGEVVTGTSEFSVKWKGAIWFFASVENMEMFMGDPGAFAPQFGGYCAFAMSKGYLASTDPEAWTIHEGKLYLNYSVNVRTIWSEDIPGNIALGDANWPTILG